MNRSLPYAKLSEDTAESYQNEFLYLFGKEFPKDILLLETET